jgi:hypothetical protein
LKGKEDTYFDDPLHIGGLADSELVKNPRYVATVEGPLRMIFIQVVVLDASGFPSYS